MISKGLRFIYDLQKVAKEYHLNVVVTYTPDKMKYWFCYDRRNGRINGMQFTTLLVDDMK